MCVLLLYTDHTPFRSPPPPQFRYVAGDDPHELPPRQAQADALRHAAIHMEQLDRVRSLSCRRSVSQVLV